MKDSRSAMLRTYCPLFLVLLLVIPDVEVLGETVRVEVQLIPITNSIVAAGRSGLVESVAVEEGQIAEKGQTVVSLDSRHANLSVEQSKKQWEVALIRSEDDVPIRQAEKTRDLAQTELERAFSINEKIPGSISQREIDALRLAKERAELAIEQARREQETEKLEAKLKELSHRMAELEVAQHELSAPINGIVVEVHRRKGEWVEAGGGVVEIAPVDVLRAEGFLEEHLASQSLRNTPVTLIVSDTARGELKLEGRVILVSPQANPVSGLVRFRAEFQRDNYPLRPGLTGVALLEIESESTTSIDKHAHEGMP